MASTYKGKIQAAEIPWLKGGLIAPRQTSSKTSEQNSPDTVSNTAQSDPMAPAIRTAEAEMQRLYKRANPDQSAE